MVFSKSRVVDRATGERDTVIVVANLDPHATRETWVHLDMEALGYGHVVDVRRRTTNHRTRPGSGGEHNFVRLGPDAEPVHIIHVRSH